MASFGSDEELFQAVRDLAARLESGGHQREAVALKEGFGLLNGLTDGWALFLESVEGVRASGSFPTAEREPLDAIRRAARRAIRRRW